MQLGKSLKNKDLWEILHERHLHQKLLTTLRNPKLLNSGQSIGRYNFHRHGASASWYLIVHTHAEPGSTNLFVQFEDGDGYQYVVATSPPVQTAGYWQLKVLTIFRSKYKRQHTRYNAGLMGWYVSDFSVPSPKLDPVTAKNRIAIVLRSYEKILRNDFTLAEIKIYPDRTDDEAVRFVRQSGRPLLVADTSNEKSYLQSYEVASPGPEGERVRFAGFDEISGTEVDRKKAEFKRLGITAEVIMPIIFPYPADKPLNIGYIHLPIRPGDRELTDNVLQGLLNTRIAIAASLKQANYEKFPVRGKLSDISLGGIGIDLAGSDLTDLLAEESHFHVQLSYDRSVNPLDVRVTKVHMRDKEGRSVLGARINAIRLIANGVTDPDSGTIRFRKAVGNLAKELRAKGI